MIIWTGLNIKIGIAQKVYDETDLLPKSGENFGKRTVS